MVKLLYLTKVTTSHQIMKLLDLQILSSEFLNKAKVETKRSEFTRITAKLDSFRVINVTDPFIKTQQMKH
jgi:hypothetical protein